MRSRELRNAIDKNLHAMAPHFGLSEEQLASFPSPTLRRKFRTYEHPKHPRNTPAFNFLENYFYFPIDEAVTWRGTFAQFTLQHECGHYLHTHINPMIRQGIHARLQTGKNPLGFHDLTEFVAEYATFILGSHTEKSLRVNWPEKLVYKRFGAAFLPKLARMNVEEAIAHEVLTTEGKLNWQPLVQYR